MREDTQAWSRVPARSSRHRDGLAKGPQRTARSRSFPDALHRRCSQGPWPGRRPVTALPRREPLPISRRQSWAGLLSPACAQSEGWGGEPRVRAENVCRHVACHTLGRAAVTGTWVVCEH